MHSHPGMKNFKSVMKQKDSFARLEEPYKKLRQKINANPQFMIINYEALYKQIQIRSSI